MPARRSFRNQSWARILLMLILIAPLFALFLLPPGTGWIWFWLASVLVGFALLFAIGRPADDVRPAVTGPEPLPPEDTPEEIRRHLDVEEAAALPAGVRVYRGNLREDPEEAYSAVKKEVAPGAVPLLQQAGDGKAAFILLPKSVEEETMERRVRPWIHWLLFALTFLTTTFAGAAHQGVNLLRDPGAFAVGLPYSTALLAILGFHELGHYFTARYHGMSVTPPYFIPVPFALGTFGAFIQMRSPAENRRSLFDVAVAGPLAGLAVALPALYFGVRTSTIVPAATAQSGGGSLLDSSILMSLVVKLSLGDALRAGDALRLSPLAFAGWLGLLVTALNLIPVGQLDGGHIARSLLGMKGGMAVSWAAMTSLFLLAIFVWPGLMLWALLVFFIAGRGAPPLNDLSPLPAGRKLLAVGAFVLLALILLPMPEVASASRAQELRCPYL